MFLRPLQESAEFSSTSVFEEEVGIGLVLEAFVELDDVLVFDFQMDGHLGFESLEVAGGGFAAGDRLKSE